MISGLVRNEEPAPIDIEEPSLVLIPANPNIYRIVMPLPLPIIKEEVNEGDPLSSDEKENSEF